LDDKNQDKRTTKNKVEFSLEPNEEKKVQIIREDEWIKRVMLGRKVLEAKFGDYHSQPIVKHDSDSDSS
jgi:hypothetical protein